MNEKWQAIYNQQYGEILRRMKVKFNGNTADAEDLVQEVFANLMERYPDNLETITNIGGLLQRSSTNLFIDGYRSAIAHIDLEGNSKGIGELGLKSNQNVEKEVMRIIQHNELRSAIARLPQEFREVMELISQDFQYNEIANQLGIDIGTVKSRVSRAKKRLEKEDKLF